MKTLTATAITLGSGLLAYTAYRMLKTASANMIDASHPAKAGKWDKVDEASWESFPSSDPPSTY